MGIGLIIVASIAASLVLTPLVRQLAWVSKAVSLPDGVRRLHTQPMPLWGGVAVFGGLLLAIACSVLLAPWLGFQTSALTVCLAISAGIVCLNGMVDDRFPLPAVGKLPGQILAVLPMALVALNVERLGCFGWELHLGWLAVPWMVGWLLLGINALNLLDGSDGLASTVGILLSLVLAAVAALQGRMEGAVLSLAMAGALAGFLVYNLPPARIYLGDSGSTLIGLVTASLALHLSCTSPGTANLPILGLLFFVPLLDTGLAILRRSLKGQAFWKGDRGHLHHQLQDRGLTAGKILLVLSGLGLSAALAVIAAVCWDQELLAWLVMGCVMGVLVSRQWIARQEWLLLVGLLTQGVRADERRPLATPKRRESPLRSFPPAAFQEPSSTTPGPMAGEAAHQERRAA